MDPVETREVFEEDPGLLVDEQEDGSAVVTDMTVQEEEEESNFYSNLVDSLEPLQLNQIEGDLEEFIKKDKEDRAKRDKQQEEGIRRTGMSDEVPAGASFAGASTVVHPLLAEACVDFSARAIKELFPPAGPVKTKILGEADTQKLDRAKRKRDFLNHLFTKKIPGARAEKEVLLTQLPLGGSQYEKYRRDPLSKKIVVEFVPIDKVFLPLSANSFYASPRITHEQNITRAEFEARVSAGLYIDVEAGTPLSPEKTASEKTTEKIEGKEDTQAYDSDGLRTEYEVSMYLELEDGLKPYVAHFDHTSKKLLGLYRNWDEEDETAQRTDWWVESKFIPWRGAYGIGLWHLIGGLSISATGALRALLDSALIANFPGAVRLKGGRTSGANVEISPTEVKEIDAPAGVDDIRKVMMPMPFNGPSPVLFQLLEWLSQQAGSVVTTAEEKIADISSQSPVGTTLAVIEQGSKVFSSIHARLHAAQEKSLEIVCRLVRQFPEDHAEDFQRFGLSPEDFEDSDDIVPVSDPNIFSEAQRYSQVQEAIKTRQLFPTLQWNDNELARRTLEMLRIDAIDSILPKVVDSVTADAVTENVAAANGSPLKVGPVQDHIAHIQTHIGYVVNPIHQLNPMPQPYLMSIMGHVGEHLNLLYQMTAKAMTAQVMIQSQAQGQELSEDQVVMRAAQQAQQLMASILQGLAPLAQQAIQFAQSKAPKPQYPPEVQATFDAAMAEINRKASVDKSTAELKGKELEANNNFRMMQEQHSQQLDGVKNMIDSRTSAIEAQQKERLHALEQQGKETLAHLNGQIELMKNDADNRQHQLTELLKNRDDNDTQLMIAQLKEHFASQQPPQGGEPKQNDAMLKQMQEMLNKIQEAKTNDALTATVEGLRQLIAGQQDHQVRTMQMAERLLQQ